MRDPITLQAMVCASSEVSCLRTCRCSQNDGLLTVICSRYPPNDNLERQIDSLLSSNLTYDRLTIGYGSHVLRSVCRLTTLTQLDIGNNGLTRLPDNCLTNFTALTSLSAHGNYITELQDGLFDGLSELKTLDLRRNRIAGIESSVFRGLSELKTLYLSHNRMTKLRNGLFAGLHNLRTLDLSFNWFVTLVGSQVFSGLRRLETLDLSYTRIGKLQNGFFWRTSRAEGNESNRQRHRRRARRWSLWRTSEDAHTKPGRQSHIVDWLTSFRRFGAAESEVCQHILEPNPNTGTVALLHWRQPYSDDWPCHERNNVFYKHHEMKRQLRHKNSKLPPVARR